MPPSAPDMVTSQPRQTRSDDPPFRPWPPLRSPHVQSVLASLAPRRAWLGRRANPVVAAARPEILRLSEGVRLMGLHSPRPEEAPRGLVILIHGWEGHAGSSYLLSMARALYGAGYDVFRLNLRDHGDTHHLNEEMFHACRLDEVVEAVACVSRELSRGPTFLGGFSLGGNFALRVALRAPRATIDLRQVFAISPVLNPARGLQALDEGPRLYRSYFLRKWRASMARKQALFPWRYDVRQALGMRSLAALTDFFVTRYTGFPTADDYLAGYALTGGRLAPLRVPSLVVAARDDPIIPFEDFRALPANPCLELLANDHGGHCGFIENLRFDIWTERVVRQRLVAAGTRDARRRAG